MIFNPIEKSLAIALMSTLLLTACGGGGDSDDDATASQSADPIISEGITSDPIISIDQDDEQTDDEVVDSATPDNSVQPDNNTQAALRADNVVSLARTSCGLSGLSNDPALDRIAIQHANYIKHVFANATPTSFNAHVENKINDIASVTGSNNPFFGGTTFGNRLVKANYASAGIKITENIAQSVYFNSAGIRITPEVAALSMTKSLLAAPYHLRSLMLPDSALIGTGMVAYNPFNKDKNKNQGYVLVTHSAATENTKDRTVGGVFTYPCGGIADTVTALYNESPHPFGGDDKRNLRSNPIGQPIYINMPSAETIKVSNVKFRDVKRGTNVTVQLLDFDQDPYKGTNYKLPANEAFILPLTDNLKSCEAGRRKGGNCGLYGNSQYRVSFDVLVDNKNSISKSFTFTTGKVSY